MSTDPRGLRLVSVVTVDGFDESTVLMLAASVVKDLDGAAAAAILESARERAIVTQDANEVRPVPGTGASASINGQTIMVGDDLFLERAGLSPAAISGWPERVRRNGQRVLFVAVDDRIAGFLGLSEGLQKRPTTPAGALIVGMLLLFTAACSTQAKSAAPTPLPTVPVVKAERRNVPLEAHYTGRVEALQTVELRARVSGALENVLFQEGMTVRRGMPLFRIDQRPYAIALRRAEAEIARVEAQLARAREEFARAERLAAADAVSGEELARRRAETATLAAELEAARAAAQDAALNLEFTTVSAPVNGRIGRAEVKEGNLITGGSTAATRLGVLHSIDPIGVYFELDPATATAAQLRRRTEWKTLVSPVDGGTPIEGPIDFVDNGIGENTGTLKVRTRLANSNGRLLPGAVVKVAFRYGVASNVAVVPDAAIGTEQGTRYVLIAGADGTVEYRRVQLGAKAGSWRVVEGDVQPGDAVILPGLPGLRPGMKVVTAEEVVR